MASTDPTRFGGDDRDAVLAIRYATLETSFGESFLGFGTYEEPDAPLRMDYYFWAVRRGGRTVVVDTGFDPLVGRERGRTSVAEPRTALARAGIDPARVERVILTHLHYDHIGNLDLFPEAEFTVDERELEFWSGPYGSRPQFARHGDWRGMAQLSSAREEGRVRVVGEEEEIGAGIKLRRLGGHCPGQQIVQVAAGRSEVVLASDSIHFYLELDRDWPFAIHHDLEDMYRAYDELRLLRAGGAVLVAGHDPLVMERFQAIDGIVARIA